MPEAADSSVCCQADLHNLAAVAVVAAAVVPVDVAAAVVLVDVVVLAAAAVGDAGSGCVAAVTWTVVENYSSDSVWVFADTDREFAQGTELGCNVEDHYDMVEAYSFDLPAVGDNELEEGGYYFGMAASRMLMPCSDCRSLEVCSTRGSSTMRILGPLHEYEVEIVKAQASQT